MSNIYQFPLSDMLLKSWIEDSTHRFSECIKLCRDEHDEEMLNFFLEEAKYVKDIKESLIEASTTISTVALSIPHDVSEDDSELVSWVKMELNKDERLNSRDQQVFLSTKDFTRVQEGEFADINKESFFAQNTTEQITILFRLVEIFTRGGFSDRDLDMLLHIYNMSLMTNLIKTLERISQDRYSSKSGNLDQIPIRQFHDSKQTWGLVLGRHNREAYEMAKSAVNSPNKKVFNPLIIWGDGGVGKTTLLHSLVSELSNQGKTIIYLSACSSGGRSSDIGDGLELNKILQCPINYTYEQKEIKSSTASSTPSWLMKVDAIIIDNVEVINNKAEAQWELLALINLLDQQNSGQIILTGSASLQQLRLIKQLRERVESSVCSKITKPDQGSAIEIAKQISQKLAIEVSSQVLAYTISKCTDFNFWKLEGLLKQLYIKSSITQSPVDTKLVDSVFQEKCESQGSNTKWDTDDDNKVSYGHNSESSLKEDSFPQIPSPEITEQGFKLGSSVRYQVLKGDSYSKADYKN